MKNFTNDREEEQLGKLINDIVDEDNAIIAEVSEVNIDNAWEKILRRKRKSLIRFSILQSLKYAAAIFIFLSAGYFIASTRIRGNYNTAYTVFNIKNAEMGDVVLPDGTNVKLNSATKLSYPMSFMNTREVFLNGEAFFDVTTDPKNPFLVHLDELTIKVTGTRFNVKSYDDMDTEATLEEGKITVINNEGIDLVELKPNENIVYNKKLKKIIVSTIDTHLKTDWTDGKIFLKNQTIEELAKILQRWYNVRIVFDNESIKNERLTGTILKDKPIDQILTVLVKSSLIDFSYEGEENGFNIIRINYSK